VVFPCQNIFSETVATKTTNKPPTHEKRQAMNAYYDVKNPPKRKIPKLRSPVSHHYVMIFPEDLKQHKGYNKLQGMPYTSFCDSFLHDCVKRMSKSAWANRLYEEGEFHIMTACLN
jgi:hypothetical protein